MRYKSVLINFFMVIVSFVVAVFIAEGTVRWIMPQTIMPRFMTDSGFGNRVPAPNKSYKHFVPGEYSITINTNNFGGRGVKEYTEEKTEDMTRICILGDSFAFGYGVDDDEVVSSVLETQLNLIENDKLYEVLNFGVSGYGQAEQLNLYLNRVNDFSCDDIFVFYFSNDPGNNVISSLYAINNEGNIVRDQSEYLPGVTIQTYLYGIPFIGDLVANSHLWSVIRNRLSRAIHQRMLSEKGLTNYRTDNDEAIKLTVGLFMALKSNVESDGSNFFVFVIPGKSQETNFPFSRLMDFKHNTIDGRDILDTNDYFKTDGHWTASGHTKAAHAILEKYK